MILLHALEIRNDFQHSVFPFQEFVIIWQYLMKNKFYFSLLENDHRDRKFTLNMILGGVFLAIILFRFDY